MLSRYLPLALLALSLLQYAILTSIRSEAVPNETQEVFQKEATRSFSLLVDLVSESRYGLRGSFEPLEEPQDEPYEMVQDGVASTRIFAEDVYLNRLIQHYGELYRIDPVLIHLVIEHESNYDPFAFSEAGAMGLMQLMPDTAWLLGVEDPWDPAQNIEGGVRYLSHQLDRFGQLELALAAYNAGPSSVDSWGGVPPFPETRAYVDRITRRYTERTAAEDTSFAEEEPELIAPPIESFERVEFAP